MKLIITCPTCGGTLHPPARHWCAGAYEARRIALARLACKAGLAFERWEAAQQKPG